MKRFIQIFLCVLIASGLNAQTLNKEEILDSFEKSASHRLIHSNDKVNITSEWFNYLAEMSDQGVNISYFRTYLFPDSTVQAEFTSGLGYVWKHSYGQVMDPHSQLYYLNSQPIETNVKYSLDSIAMPYRYRRTQKANPDTLVFQIFKHSQMTFVPTPSWSTPRSYARIPYDTIARKGASPFKEIVVLLTDAHEITASQGLIQVPVNVEVNPGEKIAVTATYFPGNPYSVDDIIDIDYVPQPSTPINAFISYDGQDVDATLDNGFYNHGSMVTTNIRYNLLSATNGWEGNYIPGTAYGNSSGVRHMDMNFLLTYEDYTGISSLDREIEVGLYPNPANEFVHVNYTNTQEEQIVFEVIDMLGKTQLERVLPNTSTTQTISIDELSGGIYFYRIKAGNRSSKTKKLMVSE